ncbi:hypothetical protein TNCV_2733851 [Trichonephila clavipes]|nr:hypothetical protein TNCV_2733851 [Trichonephila clavipes]
MKNSRLIQTRQSHSSLFAAFFRRELFPGHLLSLEGDTACPTRSPDLSRCDFFSVRTFKGTSVQTWSYKHLRRQSSKQTIAPLIELCTNFGKEHWRTPLSEHIFKGTAGFDQQIQRGNSRKGGDNKEHHHRKGVDKSRPQDPS